MSTADLFRFTTTDLRDLHVALMTAFEEAAGPGAGLNLDQVRRVLAQVGWDELLDDDGLQRALTSLTGWGWLEATQDRLLDAVHSLQHAVGLQTAVLDAIGDDLVEFIRTASRQRHVTRSASAS